MFRSTRAISCLFAVSVAQGAIAQQQIEHGATVQRGWLNQRLAIEPLDVRNSNGDQIKGAHRIGITVFNVSFPDEFRLEASSSGHSAALHMFGSSKSTMHTRLTGIDLAARQRIADAAYADFVAQLTAAGFEVLTPASLAAAAPEFASWTSEPVGMQGRFGTYLAPTGMSVRMMPGDKAQRTSGRGGMFAGTSVAFRGFDRPQAYQRSPYVARDANVTAIAVSLVIDYGVYSTSGNRRGFGRRVSTGFEEGATVAAGTVADTATVVRVWNTHSGGFPTQMTLQQPVISDADIGPANGGDGEYTVTSSPAAFVPAAIDVAERANGAIVQALVDRR
jgi:hypothetical protein